MLESNKVYCGDCFDLMPQIEDQSIDMILSDLPYSVTAKQKWDVELDLVKLWEQYERIIKDHGAMVFTAVEPFRTKLISSNFKLFRYDWIWLKNKCSGFLNSHKQPLRQHESILVYYKKQPIYNPQKTKGHKPVHKYTKHSSDGDNYGTTKLLFSGGGQTDRYPTSILKFSVVNNDSKEKYLSAQKPLALFEYLIKTYTNENDLVLDNCLGTGTSCVAAKNLNRKYIGIEINEDYCKIAEERLK